MKRRSKILFQLCQSGRYLAYYKDLDNIIANGDSLKEAKCNLKKMNKILETN